MNPNGNPTWVAGRIVSPEIKEKIRAKAIGRVVSPEARAKMSQKRMGNHYAKGWHPTQEQKEHLSRVLKGKIFSDETRRKISENRKGKTSPEFIERFKKLNIGRKASLEARQKLSAARKGVKFTEEHKKRISEAQKGKRLGPESSGWKGGLSFLPYPTGFTKKLKRKIRDRDGHVCRGCGVPEIELNTNLTIHHIDYDKQNCSPSNLISVCNACNLRANWHREYWKGYYTALISAGGNVI